MDPIKTAVERAFELARTGLDLPQVERRTAASSRVSFESVWVSPKKLEVLEEAERSRNQDFEGQAA